MYFPHAFKKVYAPIVQPNLLKTTADFIDTILPGQLAFVDPRTWNSVANADADAKKNPMLILVQGSTHNVDKVGPFHGGYKESVKSKGINPRFVSRFMKSVGQSARNQIIRVGWDGQNDNTNPRFEIAKLYQLRVDVKGDSVLAFLNRNLYDVFDAKFGCEDDCADPCAAKPLVDPVVILGQWATGINEDPIYKNFIKARVENAGGPVDLATYAQVTDQAAIPNVKAGLVLEVAYVDTRFSDCTWELRDNYTALPLNIGVSLVDESGDPCIQDHIAVKETQSARIAQGLGDSVLRQLILSNRYQQESYREDDKRINEAEDVLSISTERVKRGDIFDTYFILHSVPRMNNSSSIFDSDQYLLQINVPTGTNMSAFETFVNKYLASANTGVQLEVI